MSPENGFTDVPPQALVKVYRKILEFYKAGLEILTRRESKLVTDRLPIIVEDFLRYADILRSLVQKAAWEIVGDIKSMLYDRESKFSCNTNVEISVLS